MSYKVLIILLCAAGATVLCSCMANSPQNASPGMDAQTPVHVALPTDPTLEVAIEMVFDGKYADASKILEQLSVTYESAKDSRQAAESIFWLGYCKEKSGNPAAAAACYRRAIERYPQTAAARNAQDRLDSLGPQP